MRTLWTMRAILSTRSTRSTPRWSRWARSAARYGDTAIDAAIALVDTLVRPPDDHYQRAIVAHYPTVRRFLPAVLRTSHFQGTAATQPLQEALAFLAALERPRPPDMIEAPLAAVPKAWRRRVISPGGRPDYHVEWKAYTCCMLEQVQAALQRHDLFVTPSERWADPRAQLLQGAAWEAARPQICRALNHALDPRVELAALAHQLDQAYRRTAANLPTNPALRVERRDGRDHLVLTQPDRLEEPANLLRLRRTVNSSMPQVDLPALLLEIQGATRFAEAFTHISEANARVEDLPTSLCAVLLAEACNVGLTAVAHPDVPALLLDRLSWVKHNYLREETLAQANARLVDYHQTLPPAQIWGGGEIASVDGLRFTVPVQTLNAGLNPRYFGVERGATWFNVASSTHLGLHGVVVAGTLRDSGRILDRIARNHIKAERIAQHWDDLLRLAGSLAAGKVSGSEVLRLVQSGGRYSTLARAVADYGRIAKSLFILPYLDDEGARRRVLQQLNRQEGRHRLARSLFYGQKGELRQHYKEGHEDQLSALGLVLNMVVLWNTRYTQRVLDQLRAEGYELRLEDVRRLSPLGFDHISILGHYHFLVAESVRRGDFRPLRAPAARATAMGQEA